VFIIIVTNPAGVKGEKFFCAAWFNFSEWEMAEGRSELFTFVALPTIKRF